MSEKNLMINVIKMMLQQDNSARKEAENSITQISSSNPNKFIILNLEIIKDESLPNNIRLSSIIILKDNIVIGKNKPSLYLQLSTEVLEKFQKEIILISTMISNVFLIDNLANLVAELAASIFNDKEGRVNESQQWPLLIPHIFELYATNAFNAMIASLTILEGLFEKTDQKLLVFKDQFIGLFKEGLQNQNLQIRLATVNALLSLVLGLKHNLIQHFKIFNESVLKIVLDLLNQNEESALKKIIGKIFDICQFSPSFFKNKFNELFLVMSRVREFEKDANSHLKTQSLESIIFILDNFPELIENNQEKLSNIIELIFKNMIEIEDEIEEDWKSPADGFNDDIEGSDDQITIKLGMDFIDRLIIIVSEEIMIPLLSQYIKKMLNESNWKMKHAALMTISQIGEYLVEDLDEVQNLILIIKQHAVSSNPRIRYACCHVLGQFADDLSPDFQDNFHEEFFSITKPLLEDKVPRVVAHCFAAFTNFLENSSPLQIKPHFQHIYHKTEFWLNNGINFVKEGCLNLLSALAEGSGELFDPYYEVTMNFLLLILKSEKKKELKKLKGSAIESLTIIGKLYGKTKFFPFAIQIIPEMISIQTSQLDFDDIDPQKSYLLAGWNRICNTLESDFAPYIIQLMPSLLILAKKSFENRGKTRTFDVEESDIAIQFINLLMKCYPRELTNYIENIYDIVVFIMDSNASKDSRSTALSCLPCIVHIAKLNQVDNILILSKNIFVQLWKFFIDEEDSLYKAEHCFILQKIVESSGDIFDKAELQNILKNCEEELKKSENRRKEFLEAYDVEEETQERLNINIKCENKFEDEFKLEIANLLGKLFKTHKETSLCIFHEIYKDHILPCLQQKEDPINIEYALFLLSDGVEFLGLYFSETLIKNIYDIFLNFCLSENINIRQISNYGMSKVLLFMGASIKNIFEVTAKTIASSLEIKKLDIQKKEKFLICRESGITAFSTILKLSWEYLEENQKVSYVLFWTKFLPLIHDIKKTIQNHKIFIQILINEPQIVFGPNYENLKKAFSILFKIYKRHNLSDKMIDSQIELIIFELLKNENIKNKLSEIISIKPEIEIFIKNIVKTCIEKNN